MTRRTLMVSVLLLIMSGWLGMDGDMKFLGPVSDFTIELVRQSGRLCELPRLGAMAAPPQVGSPGSGPQATPFAEMSSGEPIVELSTCLDLVSEAEKSLDRDDERSIGWTQVRETLARSDGKSPRVRLGRSAAGAVELRSGGNVLARVDR
ncbi:hypothetical protein B296_00040210 [Ensete ventricosum]|uniref:Uncharacterized protein n=1 Tax=Ensete ventricosum TaxID=4639 RepID=A0A426X7P1_ENSVE|nr:hypothetical protein B296_00040210 [Ensete ventricosum]